MLERRPAARVIDGKHDLGGHQRIDMPAQQKAGLKEEHLFRNADNPNEVLLLFSVEDVDKAEAFAASDDLRQAMEKAGVSNKPDVYFLK